MPRYSSRPFVLAVLTALAMAASAEVPPAQPVYVLLVSTIDDHVNEAWSIERVERTLPVIARYHREFPQYGASWLLRFSGTISDRLDEVSHATGILDRIGQQVAAGIVELGYDGTDEPTFVARPRPNFRSARTPEDRWNARVEAFEWFLTEGKDPLRGTLVADRSGGLRRMLEVFGGAAAVRGVSLEIGGDPELAHVLRHMDLEPLVPGFGENTAYPGRHLAGYRGGTGGASAMLSPDARNAPELYWQDGLLALSEYVGPDSRLLLARDGAAAVRKALEALDRSRPHIVQVRLGHHGIYVKPDFAARRYSTPLEFAYDNPRTPTVPPGEVRSADEVSAEYAREDEALRWMVTEFFPANPGSRFVSVGTLQRMAGPASGVSVSRTEIETIARRLVESLQAAPLYPPPFVHTNEREYSLADAFSLLATSLDHARQEGSLPAAVALVPHYGPRGLMEADEANVGARVSRADVLLACEHLAPPPGPRAWTTIPANTVPSAVTVGGRDVSAAQFLLLMADAYLADAATSDLRIRAVLPVSVLGETFPGTRPVPDRGTTWTLKPARLNLPEAGSSTVSRER